MNVVLIAFGFPPSRASGVYRAVAMAHHLCERGHRVTVIAGGADYFALATGTDPSLEGTLPAGLTIIRVPYADLRDPVINRWTKRRAVKPRQWRGEAEAERDAIFPERYGAWRDRIVATVVRQHRETPFDFAIGTGNPYVSYTALGALDVMSGVPYLMDDRDSCLFSVYTGEPHETFDARRTWWRPLADRARQLWFVNPPIADLYRDAFPEVADRIRVVENGFDPRYFDPTSLPDRPVPDEPVFGYIGTLNTGFPLAGLLDGWRRARGTTIPAGSRLVITGGLGYREQSPAQRELLRTAEADGVELRGPVPKADIADAYRECDVLVFAREGGGLVTSGKIYEYLASGLPIAAVVPAEHDSRRVLADAPRAHVRDDDAGDAWVEVLGAALADARDGSAREAALSFGAALSRDRLLGDALDELLTPSVSD
ncbi:MAG: glycosyltransferase [Candidatus Nanopelagicales bacterium]